MNKAERKILVDHMMDELEREAQFVQDVTQAGRNVLAAFQMEDYDDLDVVMCELSHVLDGYENQTGG